jgi:hypothetical protein
MTNQQPFWLSKGSFTLAVVAGRKRKRQKKYLKYKINALTTFYIFFLIHKWHFKLLYFTC